VTVLETFWNVVGRSRRASAVVLASLLAAFVGLVPAPAAAITRGEVLTRAHTWVTKKIAYSQRSTFAGYRRDCSGFVSMAWRLGTSYTSRTIANVAKRIPVSQLRPGDAVHTPGHVAIFVKWKNKARRTYVAMEESGWGQPALHRVRAIGRGATALRYRRIIEHPALIATIAPSAETTPIVTVATVRPDFGVLAELLPGNVVTGGAAAVLAHPAVDPVRTVSLAPAYQDGVLSSIQVSTLSDPSLITGYIGGGYRFSL